MTDNENPDLAGVQPLQTDGPEAPWVELRGQRILLVEDEEPLRACLRLMLELDGHTVTEASNGAEALNLFTSSHFDLVITDFEMPVMKGNILALGLKMMAPSLPILMITGSAWLNADTRIPVDALLDKPFTVTDLQGALKKLLSVRSNAVPANVVSTQESPPVGSVPEEAACCPPVLPS